MTTLLTAAPFGNYHSLRPFSVAEYHRMIETGILDETDRVELLEGYVVLKMPRHPRHDRAIQRAPRRLLAVQPPGWDLRIQCAVTLSDSQPEPDFALVRGDDADYATNHPGPADIGLVIEVADSSLDRDRAEKARVYARAGIPVYWIVNLAEGHVEVYTGPSGPAASPGYAHRHDHLPGTR